MNLHITISRRAQKLSVPNLSNTFDHSKILVGKCTQGPVSCGSFISHADTYSICDRTRFHYVVAFQWSLHFHSSRSNLMFEIHLIWRGTSEAPHTGKALFLIDKRYFFYRSLLSVISFTGSKASVFASLENLCHAVKLHKISFRVLLGSRGAFYQLVC